MAKPKLVLYVDVVSPFAYLAFHICYVGLFSLRKQLRSCKSVVTVLHSILGQIVWYPVITAVLGITLRIPMTVEVLDTI